MKIFILMLISGFLYNCYKFLKNKQDSKFLELYLINFMELYNILFKEKEYNADVLYFLSHNSIRFNQLVPEQIPFPYTKEKAIEFILNNFTLLVKREYSNERNLIYNIKFGIINSIQRQIGKLELEKKKILFRFFPLFFISNFFELCFLFVSDSFSFKLTDRIQKIFSFFAEVAGIISTIAVFSNEFIIYIRELFISLFSLFR